MKVFICKICGSIITEKELKECRIEIKNIKCPCHEKSSWIEHETEEDTDGNSVD